MNDWLQNLKAGDKVIESYGFNEVRLVPVERVTPTQVIVGNTKYKRTTGYMVGGDSWCRNSIREATPELADQARRKWLVYQITRANFDAVSTENLEDAWTALKPVKAESA